MKSIAIAGRLDRIDEKLLRSVFHPDSTHRHGPYEGPSSRFVDYAIETLNGLEITQHHIGNVLIDLQGDIANSEAYFVAYHRLAAGRPGEGVFGAHRVEIDEDVFVGGRYIDRFERRDGVWKIAHRTGIHDWHQWSAADERDFTALFSPAQRGKRDKTDFVYKR